MKPTIKPIKAKTPKAVSIKMWAYMGGIMGLFPLKELYSSKYEAERVASRKILEKLGYKITPVLITPLPPKRGKRIL